MLMRSNQLLTNKNISSTIPATGNTNYQSPATNFSDVRTHAQAEEHGGHTHADKCTGEDGEHTHDTHK